MVLTLLQQSECMTVLQVYLCVCVCARAAFSLASLTKLFKMVELENQLCVTVGPLHILNDLHKVRKSIFTHYCL